MKDATLKGLRRMSRNREAVATPSGLRRVYLLRDDDPGFQSKPWAEISQRFQRYSILAQYSSLVTSSKPEAFALFRSTIRYRENLFRSVN